MKSSRRIIISITKWIITIIAVAMLAISLVCFLGKSIKSYDHSMTRTINSGETVLVDTLRYKICNVKRFDIIYFSDKDGLSTSIKRVVGLPGEQIKIENGNVIIDGSILELKEGMGPYDVSGIADEYYTLGPDEYFVLGDNGDSSEDSRFISVGNISKDSILGKVWFKIKPFGFIN